MPFFKQEEQDGSARSSLVLYRGHTTNLKRTTGSMNFPTVRTGDDAGLCFLREILLHDRNTTFRGFGDGRLNP